MGGGTDFQPAPQSGALVRLHSWRQIGQNQSALPGAAGPGPAGTGKSSALVWEETRGGRGYYSQLLLDTKGRRATPDKLWPETSWLSERVIAECRPARRTNPAGDFWLSSTRSHQLPTCAEQGPPSPCPGSADWGAQLAVTGQALSQAGAGLCCTAALEVSRSH